ncbi:MAG: 4'-phosphopantetheinyl transferase superfamily protein [bacterium]
MIYPIEPVILYYKIDFLLPETNYLSLLDTIRTDKQAKIKRFRFYEDKLRCLFGELLLKYALQKYFNINYTDEIITEDEFGKPHIKDKQIFFNISHSGDWVALVCYINHCGIDIETMEKPPYEIMSRNFTPKEIIQINNNRPQIKEQNFYKMWTLKESYIKMIGQGLSIPLESFCVDMTDTNKITVIDNNRLTNAIYFRLFNLDDKHIMAVCLRGWGEEIIIYNVGVGEIIK